ncbi:MAG: GNAT family N-acetyltransferase [Candidatus Thermoplasmatota archaeon]
MLRIRAMRPEDYPSLVALWRDAGLPSRPEGRDARAHIEREMEGPSSIFLVAEVDGRMVGAVLGTHDGRKGWINRLAVHPAHRGKGIGKMLVEAVEHILEEKGILISCALVEEWNQDSLEFFEEIGYIRHDDIMYLSKRKGQWV